MPAKTRYRKRKRISKENSDINTIESDNEVSFIVKRPRKDSIGVDDSSNSSADSGFKSNSSSSTKSNIDTQSLYSSSNASTTNDAAIYYAKKSPAKLPPPKQASFSSNKAATQLTFSVNKIGHTSSNDKSIKDSLEERNNDKHEETKQTQEALSTSKSSAIGRKRNKNVKGLKLDVEASAKLRKVENNIELSGTEEKVLPRRSPNGYLLPEPVPVGSVLHDLMQNRWRIGKSIGIGGFGEIYSAELLKEGQFVPTKSPSNNYVIKVVSKNLLPCSNSV